MFDFLRSRPSISVKNTLGWKYRRAIRNMSGLPFDDCDGPQMVRFLQKNPHLLDNPLDAYTHVHAFGNADAPKRESVLIFLHFQKTAGSTFNQVLRRNFRNVGFRHGSLPGRPHPGARTAYEIFRLLPPHLQDKERQKWDAYDAFSGHSVYGVHEMLLPEREYQYVTFLRDPIDRLLSYYRFIRRPEEQTKHGERARRLSLLEFMKDPFFSWVFGTRESYHVLLAGTIGHELSYPAEEVGKAIERLHQFGFVGITETFDESMQQFCSLFSCKDEVQSATGKQSSRADFREGHVTGSVNAREQMTDEELDAAMQATRFDREIYDEALKIFARQSSAVVR